MEGGTGASFSTHKQKLAGVSMLAYVDTDVHTRVIVDASPVGLGAVLVQEVKGQSHTVCYHASRSLSYT